MNANTSGDDGKSSNHCSAYFIIVSVHRRETPCTAKLIDEDIGLIWVLYEQKCQEH